jgi:hypothetical protein
MCSPCDAQGSPYARFKRALAAGDLFLIRAAAAELPQIGLEDALAIRLLLCGSEPASYERAVVCWLGRYCLERPTVTIDEVRPAVAAFERLPRNPAQATATSRRSLGAGYPNRGSNPF